MIKFDKAKHQLMCYHILTGEVSEGYFEVAAQDVRSEYNLSLGEAEIMLMQTLDSPDLAAVTCAHKATEFWVESK